MIESDNPYIFRNCTTRHIHLLKYLFVKDEHDNTLVHYVTNRGCEQVLNMALSIMIKYSGQINLQEALEHEHTFALYLKSTDEEGYTHVQLGLRSLKNTELKDFLYAVSGSLNYMSREDSERVFHETLHVCSADSVKRMLDKMSNQFSESVVVDYLKTIDDNGCTPTHVAVLGLIELEEKLALLQKYECKTLFAIKNKENLTPIQLGLKTFEGSNLNKFLHAISSSFNHMIPEDAERVFYEACDKGSNDVVHCMLKNGASRFLDEEQGVMFVATSALTEHEPLLKLRTLQQFDASKVCRLFT